LPPSSVWLDWINTMICMFTNTATSLAEISLELLRNHTELRLNQSSMYERLA